MPIQSLEKPDRNLLNKRGEGTRYALIMAGLELFGEYGIKGTSTRMLSSHSGANIAAIPYHFGSKEGLYRAVVEYIIRSISAYIGEMTRDIQEALEQGPLEKAEALAAFRKMLGGLARIFVESDEPKAWAQIIMREQANPTEAFDIYYEQHMKQMQEMSTALVASCTGLDPESDEVKLRVHALFGQILVFLISRESILRHLGVQQLTEAHVDMIHRVLAGHAEACLQVPSVAGVAMNAPALR